MPNIEKLATSQTRGSLRMFCPSGTGKVPVYELEEDGQVRLTRMVDLNAEIQLYKDSCDIGKIVESYLLSGDKSILLRRNDGAYIDLASIPDDASARSWLINAFAEQKEAAKQEEKTEVTEDGKTETDNQS